MSKYIFVLIALFSPLVGYNTTIDVGGKKVEWDSGEKVQENLADIYKKAKDLVEAFQALKKNDPFAKIYAIVDGVSLNNIQSVELTSNGSMIILKYETSKGIKTQVVETEKISKIAQW